jgi:uncharacterized protein
MNQTLSLYRLQQIDSQIDRVQFQIQAIQKKLEDDETLRQLREESDAAKNIQSHAGNSLKQAEASVQDQRIKIEQAESSLYGGNVRNPKELQDLQNDVAALKRHQGVLEDNLLEAMLAVEEAEKNTHTKQSAFEVAEGERARQNQSLNLESSSLQKELQKLTTERSALIGSISPQNTALYDQLRLQRRGVAVATISDNTCDACGSRLTPAQAQDVRSASQMARCPSCGRILYGS